MDSIKVLPTMVIFKKSSDLVVGKKYAYASNGYILGKYIGNKTILSSCLEKCNCNLPPTMIMYQFLNGQRGLEIFEIGLVEVENGSTT
jgi:hypothetical protein